MYIQTAYLDSKAKSVLKKNSIVLIDPRHTEPYLGAVTHVDAVGAWMIRHGTDQACFYLFTSDFFKDVRLVTE